MTFSSEQQTSQMLAGFEVEYPVLVRALGVLWRGGQRLAAGMMAQSLGVFWETHEYLEDGSRWIETILGEEQGEELPLGLQAGLIACAGNLARHRSEYGTADGYYRRVLAVGEPVNGEATGGSAWAQAMVGAGEIAFRRGEYEMAAEVYGRYLEFARLVDSRELCADAFNGLGRAAMAQGDFAQAEAFHRQGRRLLEGSGYRQGLAWHWTGVGELERARGNSLQAEQRFSESAAVFASLHNPGAQMLARQNLGFILLASGEAREARDVFTEALSFWERGPSKHGIALCLTGLAEAATLEGEAQWAARALGKAGRLLEQAGIRLELTDRQDRERIASRTAGVLGRRVFDELYDSGYEEGDDVFSGDPASRAQGAVQRALTLQRAQVLTQREIEVLRLAAEGLADKEIAVRLQISPATVNVHLKSIYRKLDVHSRTAAIRVVSPFFDFS